MNPAGNKHHNSGKRRRGNPSHKSKQTHKTESFLSGNLIKILGFVFIVAGLWFAAGSFDSLLDLFHTIGHPKSITPVSGQSVTPGSWQTNALITSPEKQILWGSVTALFLMAGFYISTRFHRREIPRILLPVFYAFLGLATIRYGWSAHLIFPLMLLFTFLLFLNERQLKTTSTGRVNVLFVWGFMITWGGLKLFLGGDKAYIAPFIIYSVLFYLAFYSMGITGGFHGHHRSSKYFEILAILINIFAFLLLTGGIFFKFGLKQWLWPISLVIGLQILLVPAWIQRQDDDRTPDIIAGIIILSLVIPLLVPSAFLLLFFGCLSVLLITWSKNSGNKWGLFASLLSMVLMLFFYLFDWAFSYFPICFFGDITSAPALLIKGLISNVFVLLVIWFNRHILKKTEVGFSKKWFNRYRNVKFLKGLLLAVIYLAGYWILNYFLMVWIDNEGFRFQSWFICSCLYFLVLIPVLASQKSSYLLKTLWLALLVTLAWPAVVHFSTVILRNEFLRYAGIPSFPFYFHYVGLILLFFLLIITGYYFRKAYSNKPALLNGVWLYMILITIFLLLSEFDHLIIITHYYHGAHIEEMSLTNIRLPYSILLLVCASALLILGFLFSDRFFRIAGMIIIAVVMVKIAYLDIRGFSPTGKIILLFIVGSLLLIFSYLYPKIRDLSRRAGRDGTKHHHLHHHHHQTTGEAPRENEK